MKKILVFTLSLVFTLMVCLPMATANQGQICTTIDFEDIVTGTPVFGEYAISDLLSISGIGSMEVVEEALANGSILAYNSDVYGPNGAGGENWLPGDDLKSFGNASNYHVAGAEDLRIDFNPGIVVQSFAIDIFDYGDWFPLGGSDPRVATLTAYASDDSVLATDVLSINYDRYGNDVSKAGARNLAVSGTDIAYVTLVFDDVDPGITFDNIEICWAPQYSLCAGQHADVGGVIVWNDSDSLYVKYFITEPDTCLTETHLDVAWDLSYIPQTKKDNPIPGQFAYSAEHACVTEYTYQINLADIPGTPDTTLFIAAHSVVQLPSSGTVDTCANGYSDFTQGLLKNGSPVNSRIFSTCDADCRANPDPSAFGTPDSVKDRHDTFFSLGYGGDLILTFPTLIGGDLTVYETTWGNYPQETAEVYVSRDGSTWTFLGIADNSVNMGTDNPHPSTFQLNACVQYMKIVDTTNPNETSPFPMPTTSDAFDVDAVCASFNCDEETAWGDSNGCDEEGPDFPGKNWATYIEYTLQ